MMCDRVLTDLVSLSMSIIEVGEEQERWTENRICWVSDEVCSSVKQIRQTNKEYGKMKSVWCE